MKNSEIVKTNKGDLPFGEAKRLRALNKQAAIDAGEKTFDGVIYCPKCLEKGYKETRRIISAAQCFNCNNKTSIVSKYAGQAETLKQENDLLKARIAELEDDEKVQDKVISNLQGQNRNKSLRINELELQLAKQESNNPNNEVIESLQQVNAKHESTINALKEEIEALNEENEEIATKLIIEKRKAKPSV